MTTIVWFRQDLRIADNPALADAARRGDIVPVYIDDATAGRPPGGASRWWLHHSLKALERSLGGMIYMSGEPLALLRRLAEMTGAGRVVWNRCYEPHAVNRDKEIKGVLKDDGLEVKSFNASLLVEPWQLTTGANEPYKVFTPFWRAALKVDWGAPSRASALELAPLPDVSEALDDWNLLPTSPDWAAGWTGLWRPGEAGAVDRLEQFIDTGLKGYSRLRDRPDRENVSRLSPHLHFGEISPRQIAARIATVRDANPGLDSDSSKFMAEIGWREFSHHLLFNFPDLAEANWKRDFDAYPWVDDETQLEAWRRGKTGYPLVDAGMRELWQTGYMHNRVRMVAASFLVKHLRIHWRHGEAWFHDCLVDADLANNAAGWQWVAGSGADAAPYFRIFNPTSQAKKFDPDGAYIRHWCPELAGLPNDALHAPFEADEQTLAAAGVRLGSTYPKPLVDHATARRLALEGYERVKQER